MVLAEGGVWVVVLFVRTGAVVLKELSFVGVGNVGPGSEYRRLPSLVRGRQCIMCIQTGIKLRIQRGAAAGSRRNVLSRAGARLACLPQQQLHGSRLTG